MLDKNFYTTLSDNAKAKFNEIIPSALQSISNLNRTDANFSSSHIDLMICVSMLVLNMFFITFLSVTNNAALAIEGSCE